MVKFLLLVSFWNIVAYADMDESSQEALKQTQDLLRNSSERQKAIDKDPKAKDIDNKAGALAGSKENKDQMYELAAQLMDKIAAESNGDPVKMQKLMEQAQKDPKAFYDKFFNDAQKAKVRDIANKASKAGDTPAAHP